MHIKELMSSNVITINPGESIQKAIRLMRSHKLGFLVAVKDDGTLAGVVTDRDLLLCLDSDYNLSTPISRVMKPNVIRIKEGTDVREAAELMGYYQIKRLVVTNDFDELVGIISIADIARTKGLTDYAFDAFLEIISNDEFPYFAYESDINLTNANNVEI